MTVWVSRGECFVVDAKYKTQGEPGSISSTDVYEALAFMRATRAERAVLLYPAEVAGSASYQTPGHVSVFERVAVGDVCIVGARVTVGGISSKGGFAKLAAGLGHAVKELLVA